jgi:hypothetical protein
MSRRQLFEPLEALDMKLKKLQKVFLLIFAVGALTASAAMAAPASHPGKDSQPNDPGKPSTTGTNCRPQILVVLHGTVAVAPGASPTLPFGLQVAVKSANAHGQAYIKAAQPVTITVTPSTRIVSEGNASLSSLLMGDQVTLQGHSCKADLANGATPALTARMVIDQRADPSSDPGTTTTTTTTTA